MSTFTWLYLWFFIVLQSITVILAIYALFAREASIINRIAFSAIALLRAGVSVWLGFYMLDILEAEVLDSVWIMLIVCAFSIAEWFAKRLTEKHLLKIPQPSFRDYFS